jgi:hypothetical protein
VPADEPLDPVLIRFQATVEFLLKDILASTASPKVKFMMKKILDEAMDELREADPAKVSEELMRTTAMFYWVSSGMTIQNMPLPEGFWDHVGMIPEITAPDTPAELESAPKELEAGVSVE